MRNFTKLVFATALLLSATTLTAQRNCHTMDVWNRQVAENPQLAKVRAGIDAHAHSYAEAVEANPNAKINAVVTIPVVVHVVYNTATQNISDAQIQSQITILNNDFRKLNADRTLVPAGFSAIAADAEVQFCLAQRTPAGAATNGIVRVSTTTTSFIDDDRVKSSTTGGSTTWDASRYLNIWVCPLGNSLLGYAQFPGGPASTDGVVCTYTAFGNTGTAAAPFNRGRTATHEVGHYLNLFHIWGDDGTSCAGSDQVSDTPNQADENYGCPTFPQVSCSNGTNGDMFMNYMDYTDDACMYMFTTGQKTRMQALFAAGGARVSLTTSNGCTPPAAGTCGTPTGNAATSITSTSATANWTAVSGATSYRLEYKTAAAATWTLITGITTPSSNLTGLVAGTTYNYRVTAVCASGNSALSNTVNFTTTAAGGGCTDSYEANETSATAKTITLNVNNTARICTATDIDWYTFATNTTVGTRVRIDLSTLPADFDVELYNSAGTLLGTSANGSTTSEVIIYNGNTAAATYRVRVFGYNGAFSATTNYTLRCSTRATNFRLDQDASSAGIGEAGISKVSLFPNPANDKVSVQFLAAQAGQAGIQLMDLTGKVVRTHSATAGEGENTMGIQIGDLAAGLYLVRIELNGEVITRRLDVAH
jgi:hypothetical protein